MTGRAGAAARGTSRNLLPPQPGVSLHGRAAPGRHLVPRAGPRLRPRLWARVRAATPRVGQ
eukprot:3095760-Alexandrium_andersonii.AAC.1